MYGRLEQRIPARAQWCTSETGHSASSSKDSWKHQESSGETLGLYGGHLAFIIMDVATQVQYVFSF